MAKKEITIDSFIDDLLLHLDGMGRKEVNDWINGKYTTLGVDMNSTRHKTKIKTAQKKYTKDDYPHYQPARKVRKFVLRITLKDIRPSIWRKVEVPSNITLRHLSELIIPLMGWTGYHLNQFRSGDDYYTPAYQSEDNDIGGFMGARQYCSEEFVIADILKVKGKHVLFDYDFGDGWVHEVRLSSVGEYEPGEPHIINFLGGKRACPPEDCGGVWGYMELCNDKASEEYQRLMDNGAVDSVVTPGNFDPEDFDTVEAVELCNDFNEKTNGTDKETKA